METINEIIIEQLEDGSTLAFVPAGMESKNVLGFDDKNMKEIKCNTHPIFDDQGNCIGSKFITAFGI